MTYLATPPPPIAADQLLVLLLQLGLLLLLALCLGRLADRVRLPAVVGELLTGVIIGPSLLGHLAPGFASWLVPNVPDQMHLLDAVAQFGVLLLVGVTGAHLDLAMIRRRKATAARVSLSGLILPLGLGIALGIVLPRALVNGGTHRFVFALFLGVAMCVTAIPVISKTLADMRLLHRDIGQLTLAAGMIDDTVGWFLLSVVAAAATVGVSAGKVAMSVVSLLGFVLVAVAARPLVGGLLRLAGRATQPGPSVTAAVVVVLLGGGATHALGMEPVFGAFVAGILVGTARGVDQRRLASLRTVVLSVLAPVFLASAGLRMDLTGLRDPLVALSAVAVLGVAIVGKFAGAYLGARLSRLSNWEGLALGAGMNARGVVEVIVAMTGLRLGVLNTDAYTIIVLVAIVTSVMAPPVLRRAMARIGQNEDELRRQARHEGATEAVLEPAKAA